MDAHDQLFALIDFVKNVDTADKNADGLRELKKQEAVNKSLIKDLNTGNHALKIDREKLAEDRAQFDEDLADFAAARGNFADEMKSLAKQKTDASVEVAKRRDQLKQVEGDYAKKIALAEAKLETVNTEVVAAQDCKREVEAEIDRVRRRLG